jgi:hypothetical protein
MRAKNGSDARRDAAQKKLSTHPVMKMRALKLQMVCDGSVN